MAKVKRFNTTVHVHKDEENTVIFSPGEKVPAWAAKVVTNEAVWDEADEQSDDDK